MTKYADVIVDISHENVDRTFEYLIPEELQEIVKAGSQVNIPFGRGNRLIKGFVLNVKEQPEFDPAKLKAIDSVDEKTVAMESTMIALAAFIRENYGSTMNRALKIVLPAKRKAKPVVTKYVKLACPEQEVQAAIEEFSKGKRSVAKLRLMKEFVNEKVLPYQIVRDKLNISPSTLRSLEEAGLIRIEVKENLRDAILFRPKEGYSIVLNRAQQGISDDIWKRYELGDQRPSLIRGVTGSGKTEIYIDLIDKMVKSGKQAIVLIPEIALTYQTVLRFYKKFGDRISVINSKLTYAQKYDQLEKAKKGEVDIIIGPRSALFAPFPNLGIIVIDEEHEPTYKNENVPKYHSREVAIKRAQMAGGIVVLGSATPSVESYNNAKKGAYQLYEMEERVKGAVLPSVEVVDLRAELAAGNRSILSARLDELIKDRLEKKEQIILFLNRRGYSSFVSCRSCGHALMCPHCDVSLKYHKNGKLMCHYCGYEIPMVKTCPECGSKYVGTFGIGTQRVEEEIRTRYPQAKVLRMDHDTTKQKGGHEKIIAAFADHEADILIGTQMIVKGHDFANVTLVGILAADLSLYSGDYLASERTFELLTQAAGRAGRGSRQGEVVIQTYSPDNYAVQCGAAQDYKRFFETEMEYRRLLGYPPVCDLLAVQMASEDPDVLSRYANLFSSLIDRMNDPEIVKIGPSNAPIAKINDQYRKLIYIKSESYLKLIRIKDMLEHCMEQNPDKSMVLAFDFSMMGSRQPK